ncbi:hypothetical protein Barb4_00349 [Bacteroidales bacterium Barb4]|nr:hypothetical protein Barb4_00349 [Bacteroidales bacterium Barb4]
MCSLPQENITSLQQPTGERDMYAADKSKYQGQPGFKDFDKRSACMRQTKASIRDSSLIRNVSCTKRITGRKAAV